MSKSSQKRPAPPSHSKILEYWFNIEHETLVGWECYDNIAECGLGAQGCPFCWACGLKMSNLKRLERCHIVPYALGGSNEPSNFFLMCGNCHKASPDTGFPTIFFKWVRTKESYTECLGRELSSVLAPYLPGLTSDLATKVEEEYVAMFRSQVGTHGGTISRSSLLGMFEHTLEQLLGDAPQLTLAA